MRLSGWVRLAIVFVVGFWIYGVWELTQRGSPALTLSTFTSSANQSQWTAWAQAHVEDLAMILARPLLILVGLGLGVGALVWVARGFAPKRNDIDQQDRNSGDHPPSS